MSREPSPILMNLWDIVSRIPQGKCSAYGVLGQTLDRPVSGKLVGMWMAQCPEGLPWWRVVSKDGRLPIHRRDPRFAKMQREKLEQEGVPFVEDRVDMLQSEWIPE